jgi:hypothetical protein
MEYVIVVFDYLKIKDMHLLSFETTAVMRAARLYS